VRLREDNETIVIRVPFESREELMAGDPETYYITEAVGQVSWPVQASEARR